MAPLTFYHLQDSRSFRIAWLLCELAVPHELVYAKRENNKAPANFKAHHAMGKAPMLVLEDGKTTIIESGAISEYIVEKYADETQRVAFAGGDDLVRKAQIRSWTYFAEGTLALHALAITYARWSIPAAAKDHLPEMEKSLAINVNKDMKYLDDSLKSSGSGYLVGNEVSLAEIMVAFSAQFILVRGLGTKWQDDTYPHVKQWIKRLQGRKAWQEATQQGEDSYTLDAATP